MSEQDKEEILNAFLESIDEELALVDTDSNIILSHTDAMRTMKKTTNYLTDD